MVKTKALIRPKKILTVHPGSELYYERGGQSFDHGNIQKAKVYFDRGASLAETEEDWAYGLCQLALLEQFTGNIKKSMELLEEVMAFQSSTYPEMFYFQANNYAFLENFNQALSLAKYYLLCDPKGEYAEEAEEFVQMVETECLPFKR